MYVIFSTSRFEILLIRRCRRDHTIALACLLVFFLVRGIEIRGVYLSGKLVIFLRRGNDKLSTIGRFFNLMLFSEVYIRFQDGWLVKLVRKTE